MDQRSVYSIAKDRVIISKIQAFIAQNLFSKLLKIDVESLYGHVYLIGEYEKEQNKINLLNYVKNLENVKHVTTYLQPTNQRKNCFIADDLALQAKVKAALFAANDISATNVHIHGVDCKIILVGIVENEAMKLKIQAISKNTQGVKESISLLRALN